AILGVIQVILGFLFLVLLDTYVSDIQPRYAGFEQAPGVTDFIVAGVFQNAGVILLMVTPLLTMRLIAEERRNRTLSLLFTAPVSIAEIVLGKYLGILAFLLLMVAMITLMPLSLLLGGGLDMGKLAASVLGLSLLLAGFASVGLFISALASQPAVAAVGTFGALLLLWIIDWTRNTDGGALEYLSMMRHYEKLLKGLVGSADVAYFVLLILAFIVLSIHTLDNDRLQK
ncbi:MAG: ABC transporter permease, partial [Candidatus Methylumidiphilus sp.]